MPFSVLLLTAVSSERHISGFGGDRVTMPSLADGEVALFFDKVDEAPVRLGLGMKEKKCCDGIIFYASSTRKVICLVEMKSADLKEAEEQIKDTYDRLNEILRRECGTCRQHLQQIIWLAYIYRSGSGPKKDAESCVERLQESGFKKGNALVLGKPDITDFLRGKARTGRHAKNH